MRIIIALAAAFVGLVVADPALANGVFGTVQEKGVETFTNVRNTAFVLAAFGIVGIAVMIWLGMGGSQAANGIRPPFKLIGALVAGLLLIAIAGSVIEYVTGSDTQVADTLR